MTSPWTGNVPLPGGDIAGRIEDFIPACARKYPFLDNATLRRLVCAYGTRINNVLSEARGAAELGKSFGGGLSEAELRYLVQHEWARTANDVLWRRTKLGLKLGHMGKMEVEAWFRDMPAPADADAGNRKQQ
jgi:glycerol-3-phosphate dehydrogenase